MRLSRARRRTLLLVWVAWWLLCAAIAAAFILAPSARADSLDDRAWLYIQHHGQQFCTTLAARPDIDGATAGARTIVAAGFSAEQTAEIIVWSTARFCPDLQAVLQRISAQAGKQAFT